MAGGQAIDLAHVGVAMSLPDLETMHRMKTGALIRAAIRLGAACGRPLVPDEEAALGAFATRQAWRSRSSTMCSTSKDRPPRSARRPRGCRQNKPTYVTVLRLAEAKRHAAVLRQQAHGALSSFGSAARRLHEIADWVTQRTH